MSFFFPERSMLGGNHRKSFLDRHRINAEEADNKI